MSYDTDFSLRDAIREPVQFNLAMAQPLAWARWEAEKDSTRPSPKSPIRMS